MAILRMFIELDGGNTSDLKKVLDAPREDEDIFTAAATGSPLCVVRNDWRIKLFD